MKENRLKETRELKGLSQFDSALISKINPAKTSKIENGKIYLYGGWRKKLSKALNAAEHEIFPE